MSYSIYYHRSLKFYQSNRKKEALRILVSIYNIYSIYCILILACVKLLFYGLIDKISNSCDVTMRHQYENVMYLSETHKVKANTEVL